MVRSARRPDIAGLVECSKPSEAVWVRCGPGLCLPRGCQRPHPWTGSRDDLRAIRMPDVRCNTDPSDLEGGRSVALTEGRPEYVIRRPFSSDLGRDMGREAGR
jgi:hypothetical protein